MPPTLTQTPKERSSVTVMCASVCVCVYVLVPLDRLAGAIVAISGCDLLSNDLFSSFSFFFSSFLFFFADETVL